MKKNAVAVLDYGAGNLKSVENALRYLGAEFFVTSDPKKLLDAASMIFPGDGEAAATMSVLSKSGLGEAIKSFFSSGRKILGICIGCQVIFERSEERDTPCLGIVKGTVRRFPSGVGLKVPHMGWNQVRFTGRPELSKGVPDGSSFYFVHSYYPAPESPRAGFAETEYGVVFPSAIVHGNLVAYQFHPEKSGRVGLSLVSNFLEWKP